MESEWKGVFEAVNKAREDALRDQNRSLRELLVQVQDGLKSIRLYEGVRTLDDRYK